jgi:rhodanese-related sulfurtransferase
MVADDLAGAEPPLVLDIRNAREWAPKHIARSMNIPLNHLQERVSLKSPATAALPFIARADTGLPLPPASCTIMGSRISSRWPAA